MIAIKNADGDLIKVIRNHKEGEYGFHRVFGFTSSDKAKNRIEMRRRRGFEFTRDEWDCKFNLMSAQNGVAVKAGFGCQVERLADDSWNLNTPRGIFNIGNFESAQFVDCLSHQADENDWLGRLTEILMLGIFLLIPLVYFLVPEEAVIEEDVDKKKEAITVQVIKPVNTVKVKQSNPNLKIKPLNKVEQSKRAVKRNLGFLGLVGSKDLSKVTGGVPQKLKKATAGAGKGGDAGSGGEVLTGVGKGLKKITVGNTGVAGLGGVGTKGAGGGKGGYGNTMVASGSGKGISGISVASNDLVLEGGLSRYAINATIAKYLSQVRRCYENELNKTPGLEGLVTVAFQINGQGGLNFSKVLKSSLGSPAAESCITKKMMNWKFPKPKGGVNVNINYPFMLRPVGS
jgi:hypothetical protein